MSFRPPLPPLQLPQYDYRWMAENPKLVSVINPVKENPQITALRKEIDEMKTETDAIKRSPPLTFEVEQQDCFWTSAPGVKPGYYVSHEKYYNELRRAGIYRELYQSVWSLRDTERHFYLNKRRWSPAIRAKRAHHMRQLREAALKSINDAEAELEKLNQ